jgi:integrase
MLDRFGQDYRYHSRGAHSPVDRRRSTRRIETTSSGRMAPRPTHTRAQRRAVDYAHSVVRRALQFAVEWEIIDRNPAGARFRAAKRKRMVKPGGKKARFLDPDETRRFLEAASGEQ